MQEAGVQRAYEARASTFDAKSVSGSVCSDQLARRGRIIR